MAPEPSTEFDPAGQEAALPPDIIAQAEAAVAGNAPNGQRRPLRQQNDLQEILGGENHGLTLEIYLLFASWLADKLPRPSSSHLQVPPAYSERHDQIEISQDGFDTQAKVTGTLFGQGLLFCTLSNFYVLIAALMVR